MAVDVFDELFDGFSSKAFRLEGLPIYKVPGAEWEEFQAFLEGKPVPRGANADWVKDVGSWISSGKIVRRVRVLPGTLNEYLRYELEWCYPFNMTAGEEIRFLMESEYIRLLAEDDRDIGDFWLFDDSKLLLLKYADDGTYVGEDLVTDLVVIHKHVRLAAKLSQESKSSEDFYKEYRKAAVSIE